MRKAYVVRIETDDQNKYKYYSYDHMSQFDIRLDYAVIFYNDFEARMVKAELKNKGYKTAEVVAVKLSITPYRKK